MLRAESLPNSERLRAQLTDIPKIRRFRIRRASKHSTNSWSKRNDSTVLVADNCSTLVFEDAIHIETLFLSSTPYQIPRFQYRGGTLTYKILPRRILTNEIRAMSKYGVDFDGVVGFGAEEGVGCYERGNG